MRLADQAALMTLGRLSERAGGALSAIALVRLLSKQDYGTFLQVSLIGSLCLPFILMGFPQSLLVFVPREDPARRRALIARTAILLTVPAIAAGALLASLGGLLSRAFHNLALGALAPLVGLFTLVQAVTAMVEPTLIALGRARVAGLLSLGLSTATVAATVAPAWAGWGVGPIYLCILAVVLIRIVVLLLVIRSLPGQGGGVLLDREGMSRQARFAFPLGMASISGQYNRQLDSLVVSMLFIPTVYAVYARGAFELPLIDLLPYTLATVILPRLSELWSAGRREEFLAVWNRAIRTAALAVFPAFVFACLFSSELIILLFTDAYREAVPVFRIYLLALPFRLTSYGVILQALDDTPSILRSSLFGLALNAALGAGLAWLAGPPGAAAGFVASQIFQVAYLMNQVRRRMAVPLRSLFPWPDLGRCGGVVITAGLAAWFAARIADGNLRRLAIGGLVFALTAAVLYVRTGLYGPEERATLARWVGLGARRTGSKDVVRQAGPSAPEGDRGA